MSYYDLPDEIRDKFDYDLVAALEYNPQAHFGINDIEEVLAVYEGQNDGEEWRWILALKNGKFAYAIGGCDYTGWD